MAPSFNAVISVFTCCMILRLLSKADGDDLAVSVITIISYTGNENWKRIETVSYTICMIQPLPSLRSWLYWLALLLQCSRRSLDFTS